MKYSSIKTMCMLLLRRSDAVDTELLTSICFIDLTITSL